ncbi:predicted protein [Sclerotinia sclerotiorum 1980 UF-70]|uniref:Uncharacterized protein n=1 Tax=Sclerotinia sclerotiorum (strain ATCC 18683 / 1980 / Ss-1) TaxID=665079 RepID=A7EL39_SCLS1|nr:predicted protein [Sclerotinia sclerotiorum 1980 UF-70]EDO03555.1 predicted protein [Sclerotinia sclerotiorum 1980 UF-70]
MSWITVELGNPLDISITTYTTYRPHGPPRSLPLALSPLINIAATSSRKFPSLSSTGHSKVAAPTTLEREDKRLSVDPLLVVVL